MDRIIKICLDYPIWLIVADKTQRKEGNMLLYIDACSYDDYDKVVRFLLEHDVPIVSRDKVRMVVAAEMSEELVKQMQDEVDFKEVVLVGDVPLCELG